MPLSSLAYPRRGGSACTNALDTYRWNPNTARWWDRCCGFQKAERLATIICAIVPLVLVLSLLVRGDYRSLPYKLIFLSIFLLLPVSYYLTGPMDRKSMFVRPWLGILVVIGMAFVLQRKDGARGIERAPSSHSVDGQASSIVPA